MLVNAQRDGRPAEHVQRRKVRLTPTTRCRGGVGPSDVCLQQSLHTDHA